MRALKPQLPLYFRQGGRGCKADAECGFRSTETSVYVNLESSKTCFADSVYPV